MEFLQRLIRKIGIVQLAYRRWGKWCAPRFGAHKSVGRLRISASLLKTDVERRETVVQARAVMLAAARGNAKPGAV